MAVLVYINSNHGLPKAALEAVSYAKKIGESVTVVTNGKAENSSLADLGKYGASKVLVDRKIAEDDAQQLTQLITKASEQIGAKIIVFSHDLIAKAVAPRLSVKLKAGLVSGATEIPNDGNVKVNIFSGKAFGNVKVNTEKMIISLLPNSMQPQESGSACEVEDFDAGTSESRVKIVSTKVPEGEIPLPEAERVVSAGRGMKGPENWGMIEELAEVLNAATACSRPVADIGWRPHHEHVGQTGVAIRPDLYVAVGISGAIQHLAGVNGSKKIVVINTDPEAPFFKAADYGVVGDAFEVVPKLIEAVKKFKSNN